MRGCSALRYLICVEKALRIDFAGTLQKAQTLSDGSIAVPAYIARTGVQVYQYADGTTVREYRPPEEVFAADTLASFDDVAVTDGHPVSPVTPANWSQLAKGHVDDPEKEDTFIAANVIVKDAGTIARIAAGELVELSAGYYVELDNTPGTSPEGEVYDAIQRNIVGNHVALGPKGWGRAGSDVRLYTDSKTEVRTDIAVCYQSDERTEKHMPTNDPKATEPRTDNAPVVPVSVYDRAVAERDSALAEVAQLKAEAAKRTDSAASTIGTSVARRIAAVAALGNSEVIVKLATDSNTTDRQVMEAVILDKRKIKCDASKSDAYVEAMFDTIVVDAAEDAKKRTDAKQETAAQLGGFVKGVMEDGAQHADGGEDLLSKSIKAARERDRKRFDEHRKTSAL